MKTPKQRVEDVLQDVCSFHNVSLTELRSPRRDARLIPARVHATLELVSLKGAGIPMSQKKIAETLNRKDHTSVSHYLRLAGVPSHNQISALTTA